MNSPLADKAIEELENDYWKFFEFPTRLIERCFLARKKKIRDLDPQDLRILISQNIGSQYIVPVALELLKKDILFEAEYYEGDLLLAILKLPTTFWINKSNIGLWKNVSETTKPRLDYINNSDISRQIKKDILNAYSEFNKNSDLFSR